MKKLLLLTIGLLTFNSAFAQWNVSAGLTMTDYKSKSSNVYGLNAETKSGTGFFTTVSRQINLAGVFYIEPGIGFNTTNTEEEYGSASIKNSNFTVPIEVGVKIGDKLKLNTGIQANFPISAKSIINNIETDIIEQYKGAYADVMAGISIFPTKKIGIVVKYNYSLDSVFEDTYMRDMDIRKQFISAGLKLSFD